jgi:hypothetical protein
MARHTDKHSADFLYHKRRHYWLWRMAERYDCTLTMRESLHHGRLTPSRYRYQEALDTSRYSKAKAVPLHAMQALGGGGGRRDIALIHSRPRHNMGVSGQRHAPARPCFSFGERTIGTHCTGGWVGPRAGLDTETTENPLASAGNRTLIARSSNP